MKAGDSDKGDVESTDKDISDEDSEDQVQVFEKVRKWMKTLMLLGHDSVLDSDSDVR